VFHLERSVIQRFAENQAGVEAHIWFPNLSVTRWLAFIRMADSIRTNYVIENITDELVEIQYKGIEQEHEFDFDAAGANFLTNLSLNDCFDNIEVSLTSSVVSTYIWYMWTYPFDRIVTADAPIGRGRLYFDEGVPLDSGLNFDAYSVDPWNDGWVGWSLSGRFELDAPSTTQALYGLDTMVMPARTYANQLGVYPKGPYIQLLNSSRADIEIDYTITASGTMDDTYTAGPLTQLALDLPPDTVLTAGTTYQAVAKYADEYYMTILGNSGTIDVQESQGGLLTTVDVTDGYQTFNLIPTKVGQTYWTLSDGTYTGQSVTKTIIAGPFGSFVISTISNQTRGTPFAITIQAADAYGNPVRYMDINTKVTITPVNGFGSSDAQPNFLNIDQTGWGSVQLTMINTGTGQLRFRLGSATSDSNVFTVS
jgi:hypothetical protein